MKKRTAKNALGLKGKTAKSNYSYSFFAKGNAVERVRVQQGIQHIYGAEDREAARMTSVFFKG